jgi:hypothetical protein
MRFPAVPRRFAANMLAVIAQNLRDARPIIGENLSGLIPPPKKGGEL